MPNDSDDDLPDLVDLPSLPLSTSTSIQPDCSPDPCNSIGPTPGKYDFENEPMPPWDSFSVAPSRMANPQDNLQLTFTRHWLPHEVRGVGYPPRSIGMEVEMDDFRIEIELPKTFRDARSINPAAYRNFWHSLRQSPAFELLSSRQKDVIRATLAIATFFCEDSPLTRHHWPPYRTFLLNISQLAGRDGIPGEQLFHSLGRWAQRHVPEALNTVRWEEENN
ncbi:hypothetical protein LXA43DRAFT_1092953 [Ganoderma leucocontextum]|nr:hypothetical protein LXA43DRAFT_1092953 [Ganoderma leucocontextum]